MEDHPTVLVTADPTQVGALYTTAEVATLLRVHQRTVQEWIPRRDAPGRPVWTTLADSPGRSRELRRGPD